MAVDLNYSVGVEGKNIVLKTLGRVYIKVNDKKYELFFKPDDIKNTIESYINSKNESVNNILFVNSTNDFLEIEYPGDNYLVIVENGSLYFTKNKQYNLIPITLTTDSLSLKKLNISEQIIFNGTQIPLIFSNNSLIPNLNADLLDGYHASNFAIKNKLQDITGNWNFINSVTFNDIQVNKTIKDFNNKIFIDFGSGYIKCKTLYADKITNSNIPQLTNYKFASGLEIWINNQFEILNYSTIDKPTTKNNNFSIIQRAYKNGDLPNRCFINDELIQWPLESFWYDKIFFDSWNSDTFEYTLKDFKNIEVWNSVNNNFKNTKYSLNDFNNIIVALSTIENNDFNGICYDITLENNVNELVIVPNMLFKDEWNNIGYIISRSRDHIVVQMKNKSDFIKGNKIIIIGSLVDKKSIVCKSNDNSISFLENCLDENNPIIYFGDLTKFNKNVGFGVILNGIGSISNDKIVWDKENVTLNNINIKNNNFIINSDGSGNILDLIIFDKNQIVKNTPVGIAGGDLEGNYPNPTLSTIYKNKITQLEQKIIELTERIEALEQ